MVSAPVSPRPAHDVGVRMEELTALEPSRLGQALGA